MSELPPDPGISSRLPDPAEARSAVTGKVIGSPGHWRIDNETSESVDILWSNASGSVLVGVIPATNGYGRVGVISGQEFTPLPTQAASVSPDSGTW